MARAATARARTETRDAPVVRLPQHRISIIDVMQDPKLLASFFEPQESWERWKVALSAAFGLPPPKCRDVDPVKFYRQHTGRSRWPTQQAAEAFLVCGVRGGKSRVSALCATFLAVFRDYSAFLSPGEYGTVMVMAADRKQARVVFGYIRAFLMDNPLLAELVLSETADTITLRNFIRIEVMTANFRSIRGYTVLAAVCDEIAVWQSEGSSNPDTEILTAIRSRFATIPNAMMLAISSPYARSGELWETYERHYGDKGSPDVFVWKAPTRAMNPSVSQAFIDRQYARDPARAAAEYGAEFRTDVERFVPMEIVKACTIVGRVQNPPAAGIAYRAFVDPSGGRADKMVLAIGHRSGSGPIVHDAHLAVPPPFQPTTAIAQMVPLLRLYGVSRVYGDRYGGEWPREGFRNQGVEYELHPRSKSELYVEVLPHLTSRTIELLDIPELAVELSSLERRVSPSGRELIDHPKGGHDDHANAVAGMVELLAKGTEESCVW